MSYKLVYSEKLNQDYTGEASQCVYTFTVNKPDQMGALWTAKSFMEDHIAELESQGSKLLEYELYEDTTPFDHTNYYCRVTAAGTGVEEGVSGIAWAIPLVWQLVILGVIALAGLIVVLFTVRAVTNWPTYIATTINLVAIAAIAFAVLAGIYMLKRKT